MRALGALALAAALSIGADPRPVTDEAKLREDNDERRFHEWSEAQRLAREAERQRQADYIAKIRAGIEPTTGRPLSRQRRRAIRRGVSI